MRMGIALGLVLLVVWVVAYIVLKVTSAAIHLLLLAAVVFAALHVYSWVRQRGGHGGAPR